MKILRLFLCALGCLVVLAAVVVALAFNSSVQTWLVGRALASRPGLALTIGKVDVGLDSTRVENLRLDQPGLVLAVPSLEVDAPLLDAARGRVTVKHLVAKGWTLDLSHPTPAPAPEASTSATATASTPANPTTAPASVVPQSQSPKASTSEEARAAFQGILKQLRLPVDASLDVIDLEGTVILPDDRGSARVTLTGGGLASGKEGKITCEATAIPADNTSPADTLVVHSEFTAHMDTPRTFDRISATTSASLANSKFPQGSQLQIILGVARAADGAESYSTVLQAGPKSLVRLAVELPTGEAPLNGDWSIKLTDADLAPFLLGRPLPSFTAAGQGTFTSDRHFAQIHANGQLDASLGNLAKLSPQFSDVGTVTFKTSFNVTRQGETLRIEQFGAQLSDSEPLVTVETKQPLNFDLLTRKLEASDPANDLFDINLQGIPLASLRSFAPDLAITGDNLSGRFAAKAGNDGFSLRTVAPLAVGNLGVSQDGQPLLRDLAVKIDASADYAPQGWHAKLSGQVSAASAPLLRFDATANQNIGTDQSPAIAGTFEANLPAILRQPCAAAAGVHLASGTARGNFSAKLGGDHDASFALKLEKLVAASGAAMPDVDLYADAIRTANGLIRVQAPVEISQAGRKSKFAIDAIVQPTKPDAPVDVKIPGDTLYVEDLQRFSALTAAAPAPAPVTTTDKAPTLATAAGVSQPVAAAVKAPTSSAPAATPAAPKASTAVASASPSASTPAMPAPAAAPWAGFPINLEVAFKKIVCSPTFVLTDVKGNAELAPDAVKVDALQASLGDGSLLKVKGVLSFDAKQSAAPYGLTSDVTLAGFNPAPMLMVANPDKPAPVDGKFDVAARLAGRAAALPQFADTLLGEVNVTSVGGTLRVLSVKASKTADRVSTASAVLGIFGALTGNTVAQQYAGRGQAAADAMQQLNAINYTKLAVTISRDRQGNVNVKGIDLVSPQIHLTGSGQVTYTAGVPFRQWPLEIDLQLGARDQLASDLQTLRLIGDGGADALGYVPLAEPITLTGTLQSISAAQLQDLINRAITN